VRCQCCTERLRPASCAQGPRLCKSFVPICLDLSRSLGHNRQPMVRHAPAGHATPVEGDHALTQRNLSAAAFLSTVLATTACGGQDVAVKPAARRSPTTPATSSPASRLTPTIDPKAQPAVAAYLNFVAARDAALQRPRKLGESYAPGADPSKFSFPPFQGQLDGSITSLAGRHQSYRGDSGHPRVAVTSMKLTASPEPLVVLSDCPTPSPNFVLTDDITGKPVPLNLPPGTAPPPYRVTVHLVERQGHWGVLSTIADRSRTCTA
jgi:hypothetical protein